MPEISQSNPQNTPTDKSLRTRSKFPFSYRVWDTFRFGEYHPHFVMEGVNNDKIKLRSSHQVRSFSLKAPLMEDIQLKKDYFNVPMTAIIPEHWKKFFTNPVVGDDVPSECGPSYADFYYYMAYRLQALFSVFKQELGSSTSTVTAPDFLTSIFRFMVFCESLYSPGSLLASLGIHLNGYFSAFTTQTGADIPPQAKDFDEVFDLFMAAIAAHVDKITVTDPGSDSSRSFYVGIYENALDSRDLLSYYRDNLQCRITSVSFKSSSTLASLRTQLNNQVFQNWIFEYPVLEDGKNVPFDPSRLWAYQIVCAHFYSNDHVDYVFSAELFRQLIWQKFLVLKNANNYDDTFTVNGLTYQYSPLSGYVLHKFVDYWYSHLTTFSAWYGQSVSIVNFFSYWSALFTFKRSLRFKDYFTGAHSQPLAVGDVGISVDTSNNTVSAVDVTRNIQKQRFLNAVNRVGARFEDYMKEIFGKAVAPDYTSPFWLASTGDVIYSSEVENQGSDQLTKANTVTSTLRSNGSRYEFTFDPDRDCIIIGITHFDIPRAYFRTIDRQTMSKDRFDYFNPYMQFVGDQPLYSAELGSLHDHASQAANPYFAYHMHDMQYKQRFNVANGGFVRYLEGWCFLADLKYRDVAHIGPDYIRSRSTELDRYYVSLTGYSYSEYFHFQIRITNDCEASRPMAYAPTIL